MRNSERTRQRRRRLTRASGRHDGRARLLVLVVASLALLAPSLVFHVPAAKAVEDAPFDDRFPRVAQVDLTSCIPTCETAPAFDFSAMVERLEVDPDRRRIYAYNPLDSPGTPGFPRGIAILDPGEPGEGELPRQTGWIDLAGTKLPSNKFNTLAYDAAGGRMFLGESSFQFGCSSALLLPPTGCGTPPRFAIVDVLDAEAVPSVVNLPSASNIQWTLGSQQRPSELFELDALGGLAFDPVRERLYVLTTGGDTFDTAPVGADPKGVAIVAYDARPGQLTPDSLPLWAYRVRACASALAQKKSGQSVFDISADGSFAYFGCRGTGGQTVPHGIMRVNLEEAATGDPTTGFTTEFFPLAGQAGSAFAVVDAGNDRMAVGITAPGAQRFYVFDATQRSWVASMLMGSFNTGGGFVDRSSGRMYVASQGEGIRFIDPGALPAIALATPLKLGYTDFWPFPDVVVDPVTRRVAVPPSLAAGYNVGPGKVVKNHLWVYEDKTAPFVPPPRANPDDETTDIDEALAASVSHTAFASAYGAHLTLVGGVGFTSFTQNLNDQFAKRDETAPLRLEQGDRGLFLSQVERAQLSGETERGQAAAGAVGAKLDEATASDLRGKYSYITGQLGIGGGEAAPCDQSAPSNDCLTFDAVTSNVGELERSSCNDFGSDDDQTSDEARGSSVSCTRLDRVTARATSSASMPSEAGPVSFGVAFSESDVDVQKLPGGGVLTRSTSVARGVTASVPGLGTLTIGEIRAEAVSTAAGRPGTALSTLETVAKNVRITNAAGEVVFDCGVSGVDNGAGEAGEYCAPATVAAGINRHLAPRLVARGPRQELDPLTVNSPGGARAIVVKDLYAYWNDTVVNGDSQREVTALDLTFYSDGDGPSRLTLQLAGVYSEAQYQIGSLRGPDESDPTKLTIGLLDGDGGPLAGGVFQVREAGDLVVPGLPGRVAAACVTAEDGFGDCSFDDLPPGDYVISETSAPPGFAPADDIEVELTAGRHTEVIFRNLEAIGSILIRLTDDDDQPLEGGSFELLADNGDLVRGDGDKTVTSCTTDASGTCGFEEVALGSYIVHQTAAPPEHLLADDAAFALTKPGQVAELHFTTGLTGIDGTEGEPGDAVDVDEGEVEEEPRTALADAPTDSSEVVVIDPPPQPLAKVTEKPLSNGSLFNVLGSLPSAVAAFLRRNPAQAVLFGLVWLLFGSPVYLTLRRRNLILSKASI